MSACKKINKKKKKREKEKTYRETWQEKICVITGQHFTLLRGNTEIEHTEKP